MTLALIGVDSGGTRTNVLVRVGEQSQMYEVSESLSGSLSPTEYPRTLRHMLAPADSYLRQVEHDGPVAVFVSAAGFTPAFREDFLDAVNSVVPHMLQGKVESAGVANDAPSLLFGHSAAGIVIAGTGSNVLLQAPDGQLSQFGGHEWVASDYGSGFWIGLRAIRRAYRDHEANVLTVLRQRLMEEYGIRSGDDRRLIAKLRDLAIADRSMKPEIARFAAAVCAAAERGDAPSQDIVKAEAEDLADVLAEGLRRTFGRDELGRGIKIVECGSLLGNEFYRSAFEAQVEMRLRSGSDHHASIQWTHVVTGTEAAVNLARGLADSSWSFTEIPAPFRPLVVHF